MDIQASMAALRPAMLAAGRAILAIDAQGVSADQKSDGSPVTAADRAAEQVLLSALAQVAPGVPVVSEESAASHALQAAPRFFLVDPLDGTKEFLKRDGQGAYTVNIGLIEAGLPVAGWVYAPALDRLFGGVLGQGAFEVRGGVQRAISVRRVAPAQRVAVASASHPDAQTQAWLQEQGIAHTTSMGSSLKFCVLACGEADVYPRWGPTMEWDTAAADAVLRAAGGEVTQPDGSPFRYGKPGYRNGAFIAWASRQ